MSNSSQVLDQKFVLVEHLKAGETIWSREKFRFIHAGVNIR